MKTNLLKSIFISLILLVGATNAVADTYILGPDGSWTENTTHKMVSSGITNWVYKNLTPSGQWTSFKVKDGNSWYGKDSNGSNVTVGVEYTPTTSGGDNYCDFTTNYKNMFYYFFFNTSTKKLMIQPDYYLVGTCGKSNQAWGQTQNKTSYDATKGFFKWNTCNLTANTVYKFKLSGYGAWTYKYEDWNGVTVVNGTKQTTDNDKNIAFKSTNAGTAVVTLNPIDNKMVIYCPYLITYNKGANGTGTISSTVKTYDVNCTLSSSKFTRTGYTQDGWSTSDGGNKAYDLGAAYTKNENITLYPHWKANTYTVTLDACGGTGGTASVTATYGAGMPAITKPTRTGYTFNGYYDAASGGTQYYKADGSSTRTWNKTTATTLYAQWTPAKYTITYKDQGGSNFSGTHESGYPTQHTYGTATTLKTASKTGYTFGGWFTNSGTAVTSLGATAYTANITLYAKWTANTYTVTLDQEGAAVKGDASATATYDAALPQLKKVPTAQNGYAFMGYWDSKDGAGKQYYNADGTSAANWDKTANATLYAYFKKAEISEITLDRAILDPVPAGGSGSVTATATVAPEPVGDFVICWQLLYSNGDPVAGHDPAIDDNSATFSIAGIETGHYMIRATLRTGTSCNSGTVLHTLDQNFTIAANFTVTVRYTCDGKTIAAPTKHTGHATNPTEITAPDIGGYDFKEWVLGDGIYSTSTLTKKKIEYTATYDGYLTATYQKKKLIFLDVSKLPNKANWTAPHIYLYKAGGYWDSEKGAGSGKHNGTSLIIDATMTPVPGTTDIWYYEYANAADFGGVVAFTSVAQVDFGNFHGCKAIYRSDFTSGTPMFVPSTEQEPEVKNNTSYYNKGYWVKYMDGTGYELRIFNQIGGDGTKEVMSVPLEFTSSEKMPMSVTVDLEAGHTYGFKIYRADGKWYGNTGTMTNSSHTKWAFTEKYWDNEEEKTTPNCGLTTGVSGNYTFTLIYDESSTNKNDFEYRVTVDYPASVGDYRIIYTDNNEKNWSGNPKRDGWFHPSRIIKKATDAKDIVSFFIDPKASPTIQYQSIKSVANNGTVTWNTTLKALELPKEIKEAGVYNLIVTQTDSEIRLEAVEPYTGNFYIRVDAADGKWYDYKTNPDNLMTYSAFSESEANSFGDKFSHYKTKWCPRGTNVKFVIANDYSLCISDTLARDLVKASGEDGEDYMTEGGELYIQPNTDDPTYDRYSANIRFMWNRKNNKISRAYLASSSNDSRQFLVLKGCQEIKDENGNNLSGKGDNHGEHCALLQDTQDWIYERTFMVQPGTRVKLYACYANTTVSPAKAQYFRGKYDSNQCGSTENSVQILGGNGTEWEKIRVIYDFKTNRLMRAWVPSGEISEDQELAADVMIMRNHQGDATCITLAEGKSLTEVKTVYGALRFNRWTLNNKDANTHQALSIEDQKTIYERALFFISFPFNVHLSDAFGLGTYGTHWVISTYNGKRRAERGYFAEDCINEDCTNWDYIWDPTDFVMEANVGYLLSLDLELMKDNDESFWSHNINYRELLFPSQVELATITKTNYTMPELGSEYECTINLNTDGTQPERDRRVKDSYWRCIGVPSFADYSGLLKDGSNESITWQPAGGNLPFLYEWNVTNNNLVVRSATNYRFRPTFAYLIQNGSEINWTLVSTKPNPIIARERSEATSNYEWKIALLRNGNTEDQTFVRVTDDETVTAAFDFNQDLSKEFNYGANIYTLAGYERLAANSLPLSDHTTVVSLGLDIDKAGDYTIAMPEGVMSVGVTLYDAETGTRTNLSAGMDYTVSLNKGVCHNRLYLEISPIQHTPTDIEYTDQSTRKQSVRKVLIDGKLFIRTADGVLYDAQGHRL